MRPLVIIMRTGLLHPTAPAPRELTGLTGSTKILYLSLSPLPVFLSSLGRADDLIPSYYLLFFCPSFLSYAPNVPLSRGISESSCSVRVVVHTVGCYQVASPASLDSLSIFINTLTVTCTRFGTLRSSPPFRRAHHGLCSIFSHIPSNSQTRLSFRSGFSLVSFCSNFPFPSFLTARLFPSRLRSYNEWCFLVTSWIF